MNIEDVPFNAHVGIRKSTRAGYLLEIDADHRHTNHVGTLHGAVTYALAEASTGAVLLEHLAGTGVAGVIRRATSKYSAPAQGLIRSKIDTPTETIRHALDLLQTKSRQLIDLETSVYDSRDAVVGRFTFRWFLSR